MLFSQFSVKSCLSRQVQRFLVCRAAFSQTTPSSSHQLALVAKEKGDPMQVLELQQIEMPKMAASKVMLRVIAATVNPADLNMVMGTYASSPKFPAVMGAENVAEVVEVGSAVASNTQNPASKLKPGDHVICGLLPSGAWQQFMAVPPAGLIKLPSEGFDPILATQIRVNPMTAQLMLDEVVPDLKPGNDVIIQNGSNSAVGLYVMQMAKARGLRTINVFRHRSSAEANQRIHEELASYGSTWSFTDEEIKQKDLVAERLKELTGKKVVRLGLGINGGRTMLPWLPLLAPQATICMYGAMDHSPLTVPIGPLIFQDVRVCGFWLLHWINRLVKAGRLDEMERAYLELYAKFGGDAVLKCTPTRKVPLQDWKDALQQAYFSPEPPSGIREKVVLVM